MAASDGRPAGAGGLAAAGAVVAPEGAPPVIMASIAASDGRPDGAAVGASAEGGADGFGSASDAVAGVGRGKLVGARRRRIVGWCRCGSLRRGGDGAGVVERRDTTGIGLRLRVVPVGWIVTSVVGRQRGLRRPVAVDPVAEQLGGGIDRLRRVGRVDAEPLGRRRHDLHQAQRALGRDRLRVAATLGARDRTQQVGIDVPGLPGCLERRREGVERRKSLNHGWASVSDGNRGRCGGSSRCSGCWRRSGLRLLPPCEAELGRVDIAALSGIPDLREKTALL